MKPNAILVNASRGPVIDEAALVAHCQANPDFRAGLDVFEDEPAMKPGLAELDNVVIVPHIASATSWTREGMATLAATNVAAILTGYPVWPDPNNILAFLERRPAQGRAQHRQRRRCRRQASIRNRPRIRRIRRIYADFLSAVIRLIRHIRSPSFSF